jgi:hypothetical protein
MDDVHFSTRAQEWDPRLIHVRNSVLSPRYEHTIYDFSLRRFYIKAVQGSYSRACHTSYGQASRRETSSSRQLFPRMFEPAAQSTSLQVKKLRTPPRLQQMPEMVLVSRVFLTSPQSVQIHALKFFFLETNMKSETLDLLSPVQGM